MRRAVAPRIVAVSTPCGVIAVVGAKPFLARFIPFHSSGSHPPEIRSEAAECPNAPQPTS